MLRDFTIQPATGGSPAGKAYTHQFPKHVFLYLGMFFIEHVLFLHYEARCWLLIGHEPFYDDILPPSPVRCDFTEHTTAKLHGKRWPLRRSCLRNCGGAKYKEPHTTHSFTGSVQLSLKTLGHRIAASSTADLSLVRSDRHFCSQNHKDHNHHRHRLTGQRQWRKKKKEKESISGEFYLYLEGS